MDGFRKSWSSELIPHLKIVEKNYNSRGSLCWLGVIMYCLNPSFCPLIQTDTCICHFERIGFVIFMSAHNKVVTHILNTYLTYSASEFIQELTTLQDAGVVNSLTSRVNNVGILPGLHASCLIGK